ncbi:DUF1389 domain-containing protein [Chlamydia sp. 12-01]|uniref:DUF1389 domain-containing protein n=1 Tax=Chlamydia sp. 12-01 TaxID=3002742 RepID=UPI0035D4C08F
MSCLDTTSCHSKLSLIDNCLCDCITYRLCKLATIISSIFFGILIVVSVSFMVSGVFTPIVILGLVVSLVFYGAVLITALYYSRRPHIVIEPIDTTIHVSEGTPLPSGFLSVVKNNYPVIISELCFREDLTLQELRILIEGLIQRIDIQSYPENLREKLQRFSFPIAELNSRDIERKPLDEILLKECPFYFINKLISLGAKEFPEAEGLSPVVYWTYRTAISDRIDTVFTPYVWMLSQVVTQEEYQMLLENAQNNTWDQVKNLLSHLYNRLNIYLDNMYEPSFSFTPNNIRWELQSSSWLLYLCKHELSWEQLQLFTKIDCHYVNFLCEIEQQGRGGHLARNMLAIFPYIQEEQENFDPSIALFTWKEWITDYENRPEGYCTWRAHASTIKLLNCRQNGRQVLMETSSDNEEISSIVHHTYDRKTGARISIE